ncbi:MAG: hypothetical protein ABJH63_10675 [Rhizobiaceae bacterium]
MQSKQTVQSQWWLDGSALPDLIWARCFQGQDGTFVQTIDGSLHLFENEAQAVAWLREDEYENYSDLRADGEISAKFQPPADESWINGSNG